MAWNPAQFMPYRGYFTGEKTGGKVTWQVTIYNPNAAPIVLPVESGTVTEDATSASRWSADLVVPSLDGLAAQTHLIGNDRKFGDHTFGHGIFGDYRRRIMASLIMPKITTFTIEQMYEFPKPDGPGFNTLTIPMGVFRVSEPSYAIEPEDNHTRLAGYDYAVDVAAAGWERPYVSGIDFDNSAFLPFLRGLVASRLRDENWGGWYGPEWWPVVADPTNWARNPGQVIFSPGDPEDDPHNPWETVQKMATDLGRDIYFNRAGRLTVRTPKDPHTWSGPADWVFSDVSNVLSYAQTPSGDDLVNTVIVTGDNTNTEPVMAVVQDFDGPYGLNTLGRPITREYSSPFIANETQAYNTGISLLRQYNALTEIVELSTFPVPHLDAGDIIELNAQDVDLSGDRFRVETITHGIGTADPAAKVVASRRIG